MNTVTTLAKRHALLFYCALTIGLSFGAALLPVPSAAVPVVLVFIPALVALGLTALSDGRSGVLALLGKPGQWSLRPGWIVAAVALGLALRLGMSAIALLLGWIPALQLRPWAPLQFVFFATILFIFAVPEELGWRAYALPKLLTRHSPLVAGLVTGVLWGTLHLALHMPGMMH